MKVADPVMRFVDFQFLFFHDLFLVSKMIIEMSSDIPDSRYLIMEISQFNVQDACGMCIWF